MSSPSPQRPPALLLRSIILLVLLTAISHAAASDRNAGNGNHAASDSNAGYNVRPRERLDATLRFFDAASHYEALGLDNFAEVTSSTLKKAYYKQSLQYHPDKWKHLSQQSSIGKGTGSAVDEEDSADFKNMGERIFIRVSEAYQVLSDEQERARYDRELRQELEARRHRKRREAENDAVEDRTRLSLKLALSIFKEAVKATLFSVSPTSLSSILFKSALPVWESWDGLNLDRFHGWDVLALLAEGAVGEAVASVSDAVSRAAERRYVGARNAKGEIEWGSLKWGAVVSDGVVAGLAAKKVWDWWAAPSGDEGSREQGDEL